MPLKATSKSKANYAVLDFMHPSNTYMKHFEYLCLVNKTCKLKAEPPSIPTTVNY